MFSSAKPNKSALSEALVVAANNNDLASVITLLETGTPTNAYITKTGDSPLHCAVNHNNVEMILVLRRAKADICAQNKAKNTPIAKATLKQYWNCVIAFTIPINNERAHLSPNETQSGYALLKAAEYNKPVVVRALLTAGAQHDWQTNSKYYPIHYSIQHNNLEMLRDLRRSGASDTAGVQVPAVHAVNLNRPDALKIFTETLYPFTKAEIKNSITQQIEALTQLNFTNPEAIKILQSIRESSAPKITSAATTITKTESTATTVAVIKPAEEKATLAIDLVQAAVNRIPASIKLLADHYKKNSQHHKAILFTALYIYEEHTTLEKEKVAAREYIASITTTTFLFLTETCLVSQFLLDCLQEKDHPNYFLKLEAKHRNMSADILLLTALTAASESNIPLTKKDKLLSKTRLALEESILSIYADFGLNPIEAKALLLSRKRTIASMLNPATTSQVMKTLASTVEIEEIDEKKNSVPINFNIQKTILDSEIDNEENEVTENPPSRKSSSSTNGIGFFDNETTSSEEINSKEHIATIKNH